MELKPGQVTVIDKKRKIYDVIALASLTRVYCHKKLKSTQLTCQGSSWSIIFLTMKNVICKSKDASDFKLVSAKLFKKQFHPFQFYPAP